MTTHQESSSSMRILNDEPDTRYIELSMQFEQDIFWHPSVTITIAAFTDHGVLLHRLTSEETAVRFDLSTEEIQALITGYSAYLVARENEACQPAIDPLADQGEDDYPPL